MKLLLKDCGLNGCRGSVRRCRDCRRSTVHFCRPGGWPICGMCGAIVHLFAARHQSAAYTSAAA